MGTYHGVSLLFSVEARKLFKITWTTGAAARLCGGWSCLNERRGDRR